MHGSNRPGRNGRFAAKDHAPAEKDAGLQGLRPQEASFVEVFANGVPAALLIGPGCSYVLATLSTMRAVAAPIFMTHTMVSQQDRDRLIAEIDALNRLYEDTKEYLENGLQDPSISQEDFAEGAMRAMRLLIRLKVMLDDYAGL